MPYQPFKGRALSKSKLADAIKLMHPSDKALGHKVYWEYVPDDKDYTDDQAMEFIISAMPGPGNYPAKTIAILIEKEIHNRANLRIREKGDPFSLPEMAHRAMSLDESLCREAMAAILTHKHVPEHIKSNDAWALVMAIATGIGHIAGNNGYTADVAPGAEAVFAGDGVLKPLHAVIDAEKFMRPYF